MEKSLKAKNIENNLLKLLSLIMENQNILRYLFYLDNDPLAIDKSDVVDNPLETGHIKLTLYNEDVLTEQKAILFLNPTQGNFRNQPLSDIMYDVAVIMPTTKWILSGLGQLRAFRILDEVCQMVDGQKVAGIGECEVNTFRTFKIGTSYSGMFFQIKVNSSTLKGLR